MGRSRGVVSPCQGVSIAGAKGERARVLDLRAEVGRESVSEAVIRRSTDLFMIHLAASFNIPSFH